MRRIMLLVTIGLSLAVALSKDASAQAAQAAQGTQPSLPEYKQLVPGLLMRTRFTVDAPANRRVELWDFLVGPGMRSAATSLQGGAVFEVRGGAGRLVIGGKEQELRSGAAVSIPEGTSFQLVNTRTDLSLSIRATVISARAR